MARSGLERDRQTIAAARPRASRRAPWRRFARSLAEIERASDRVRYGAAIALLVIAILVRLALAGALGSGDGYFLFVIPVLVAALYLGAGPGLLVAVTAPLVAVLLQPAQSLDTWLLLETVCIALALTTRRMIFWRNEARATALRAQTDADELALLIDGAVHHAIYLIDPDGLIVRWNKGAERIKGSPEAEVIGRSWEMFSTPEQIARGDAARVLAIAEREGSYQAVMPRRRRDGTVFTADVTITALRSPDGSLRGFAKVLRDVTSEEEARQRVEASEAQLRAILRTIPDAMVIAREDGQITSINAGAVALFGYAEDEVIGRNVSIMMPEPDRSRHDSYLARFRVRGGGAILGARRRVIGRKADGSTFPLELSIGHAIGGGERLITGFMRDLTEREARSAQLRAVQAELVHVTRTSAMSTMAATLGHELNQPMTAIATYLDGCRALLAQRSSGYEKRLDAALSQASAEAVNAGTLVTRLRRFIQDGESLLGIEHLRDIIDQAIRLMEGRLHQAGVDLDVDAPRDIVVIADRIQVQQILCNLIRNALEAMADVEEPRLQITARTIPTGRALIELVDSGRGFAADEEEDLFRAFRSTKKGGMGLGLSICRTMVEAQGGHIEAFGRSDGGAVFRFTLPLAPPDGQGGPS